MSFEWQLLSIGEIGRVVTGKTPSTSKPENFDGAFPFITIPDLGQEREISKTARTVSNIGATALGNCRIPAKAVLMSCIATVGKTGITIKPSFTNQQINAVICGPSVIPEYLYYVFRQLGPEIEMAGGGGSVFTNVSKSKFSDVRVPVPSLLAQESIVSLLAPIDDRITLLRETNATLEAIAQALFKSWFVDFDPVRAKLEGRTPEGMDEATAALFPDGFEESELGFVPRGWRVFPVADVASVVKGKSYFSKDLVDKHDTALVTLKSFARGGGFRLDGFKPYSGSFKATQVVVSGDLIIAYTDVTQAAELIGKPAIVIEVAEHKTLVASLDVGIVRPLKDRVTRQFLYGLFKTDAFQAHTFSHTSGTTVLHLSKDGVGSYQFVCPPFSVVEAFSVVAEALLGRQQVNIDQMRNLANLRDTLLPRLISGQLRLPEVS